MFPYICCLTCGNPDIGAYYSIINKIKADRIKEFVKQTQHDESMLMADIDSKIKMGDVYDDFGINLSCCRMRLLTNVEYDKMAGYITDKDIEN